MKLRCKKLLRATVMSNDSTVLLLIRILYSSLLFIMILEVYICLEDISVCVTGDFTDKLLKFSRQVEAYENKWALCKI